MHGISVIVPLAPGEDQWQSLLTDLVELPTCSEVILVGCDIVDQDLIDEKRNQIVADLKYVHAPKGRAYQMNAGAMAAHYPILWFLHADSKLPKPSVFRMAKVVSHKQQALFYFDLLFQKDGPKWTTINSYSARFYANWLGLPSGEQGLCVLKSIFKEVGGYNENLTMGEDLDFVWKIKRAGYPIKRIGAPIYTSARRYVMEGWMKTTFKRMLNKTAKSAPQCIGWAKDKVIKSH